jgi:hypothetical protein
MGWDPTSTTTIPDLGPEEVRLIPISSTNRSEDPANSDVLKNGVSTNITM